jgi:hypothetical protein
VIRRGVEHDEVMGSLCGRGYALRGFRDGDVEAVRMQCGLERVLGVGVFDEEDFHMERAYAAAGYGKIKGRLWRDKEKAAAWAA